MKVCSNCSFSCSNVWEVRAGQTPSSNIDIHPLDGFPLPVPRSQGQEGGGNPVQEVRLHCREQGRQLGPQEGAHPS